jgi:SAM-dependent methyltransferase
MLDLGSAPPSNAYLTEEALHRPEKWFPLRVLVCQECWLAQTEDYAQADELFDADYAYFSGFSSTWLSHCERYVDDMIERFGLDRDSHVLEVAANDGSLLQFIKAREIPCTGIEPTASTAAAARTKGIDIIEEFFGTRLAHELSAQGKMSDLTVANNVLAHVPDINDFVAGFSLLLKPEGVATFEFPHLLKLISESQFDTVYHEHFSYLSLTTVDRIFKVNGLQVFDAEEHPLHGGSLRVYAQRSDTGNRMVTEHVAALLETENAAGLTASAVYAGFQQKADGIKNGLLSFLIEARRANRKVAAYGAAAKGNTLLNYSGVRPDLLSYVVDRNPAKQGKYMPGSRIPIMGENRIMAEKPDYVLILPWNIKAEVMGQLDYIGAWGGQFVIAAPEMKAIAVVA